MKLYRARFGFWYQDWDPNDKLVSKFYPQGSLVCLDREPNLNLWEPIRLTDVMAQEARQLEIDFKKQRAEEMAALNSEQA